MGIGGQGVETYRAAVRLGAEEARLRQLSLRLVHGSRPARQGDPVSTAGMEHRQRRGRRLVNGAARDLAGTPLGRELQILTECSPQTGVDLLLAYGRTAVMLVLQRGDGWNLPAGPTTSAVTAAAGCPTLVTRSGERSASDVGVLVVRDLRHDPAPAIALALREASLRRITVTVLDGRGDGAAVRVAIRDASRVAALMVVVRPVRGEAYGPVAGAVDDARCPVLMVAPVDPGG